MTAEAIVQLAQNAAPRIIARYPTIRDAGLDGPITFVEVSTRGSLAWWSSREEATRLREPGSFEVALSADLSAENMASDASLVRALVASAVRVSVAYTTDAFGANRKTWVAILGRGDGRRERVSYESEEKARDALLDDLLGKEAAS
jgi:hypothetical protein